MARQTSVNASGFNVRSKLFKAIGEDEKIYFSNNPIVFYAKDYRDFSISTVEYDGIMRQALNGAITTFDLNPKDINANDRVEYSGQIFNVVSVLFKDCNFQKAVKTRVDVECIIELVA